MDKSYHVNRNASHAVSRNTEPFCAQNMVASAKKSKASGWMPATVILKAISALLVNGRVWTEFP
jgi:hypothetical protein